MKRRPATIILLGILVAAMACALAACGGGSSSSSSSAESKSAAEATEFAFFSVVVPEGYTANIEQHTVSANPGGSFYVSVQNTTADELLEIELKDEDYKEGDPITAGNFTWKVATSEKWEQTYYITDWEDGSIEVSVKRLDDQEIIKAFLGSLTPYEDAYKKWQDEK